MESNHHGTTVVRGSKPVEHHCSLLSIGTLVSSTTLAAPFINVVAGIHKAEDAGIEPAHDCSWLRLSKPTHYRSANPQYRCSRLESNQRPID